jgi:EmrB/QacA subfamily drug resistance transporter
MNLAVQTDKINSFRSNRWQILAAVLCILIMTPLDGTSVNVALPIIQREFHLALSQVAWVSLVYLLFCTSFILPFGRMGDIWGFRRIFLSGACVFVLSSAMCGMSPAFHWLIIGRMIQGVGACMIMSVSSGLTTAIFPDTERGRALGVMGMVIAIGAIIGPSLGGFLTSIGGWRLIFLINLPIGIIGLLMCSKMLPEVMVAKKNTIDWVGAIMLVLSLGSFTLAVTQGEYWGWKSTPVLGLMVVWLVLGSTFFITELRSVSPLLDLHLFRHPVFTGANIALTMNFMSQFCVTFLVPKYLMDGIHLSVAHTGLVMMTSPAAIFAIAPFSGALSDRIGTRPLTVAGELLVTLGLASFACIVPCKNLVYVVFSLAVVGIGAGLFQSPNNSAIMGSIPPARLGTGSAVLAAMRNLGMALGITVSSVSATLGAHHYLRTHAGMVFQSMFHGIQFAFFIGALFAFFGVLASAIRPDAKTVVS